MTYPAEGLGIVHIEVDNDAVLETRQIEKERSVILRLNLFLTLLSP